MENDGGHGACREDRDGDDALVEFSDASIVFCGVDEVGMGIGD
jgi:hypothetical protein